MRTLSPDALAATAALSARAVLILELDLGAGGVVRFAETKLAAPLSIAGTLADASVLKQRLHETSFGDVAAVTLTVIDTDGALKTALEAGQVDGAGARILQHFDDLGESDLIPLAAGTIEPGSVWQEGRRRLVLTLGGLSVLLRDRVFGRIATRTDFPQLAPGEEGMTLPLVFGRRRRVRAVHVTRGAETTLARGIRSDEMKLYVQDASAFPPGPITIRVGYEEMNGSFDGNTFAITQRPTPVHSTTSAGSGDGLFSLKCADIPGPANKFRGYWAKITLDGYLQERAIRFSDPVENYLGLYAPFEQNGVGAPVPGGLSVDIASLPQSHEAGEPVVEVVENQVYLVSDAPALAVDRAEGWGVVDPKIRSGSFQMTQERRGYVPLPADSYSVNLNDTTTFPELGRAVATLSMPRPPSQLGEGRFLKDEVWVDVRGVAKEDETLLENPAEILAYLLTEEANLPASRIDSDSFTAAASARSDVAMAFALDRAAPLLTVLRSLAFQARLALVWENGTAACRVLDNARGTPALTLDESQIEAGTVELSHTEDDALATEIVARYRHRNEQAAVVIRDDTAEVAWGRRVQEISFWAFEARHQVRLAAEWWLRRWRHRYRQAALTAFLPALPLQRLDTVTLDHPDLTGAPLAGMVRAVEHAPGDKPAGHPDRVTLRVTLPVWGGCASSCEHDCETGGCEVTGCELSCTAGAEVGCGWTCETTCEEVCELACVSMCQVACMVGCQITCRSDGEMPDCQSGCETGCETSCESMGCESACETCCEVTCETAQTETIMPIREVLILTPPATPGGVATVVEADRADNARCDSFSAYDPFHTLPATGEQMTAYLNFNSEWVLVPGPRNAKYVRVLSDAGGGQYQVIEQDPAGTQWGDAFYAWAVDSV